jgi:dTDP-4-amino-4,6-dideoxygalactose transaminase
MINVTKTFLPPLAEYMAQVERAYKNAWLTNRGELVRELEEKVSHFLGLTDSKMICMNNGTIPLQIALKLLAKGGEVITTPFSYVATTASIVWENCTPVFVDIHPEYLTIDETLIEAAITDRTTCILATHVFGNPCNIEEIERIAKKHGLQVIYDAAHCFGVNYNGKSIFEYGDVSTCSFHATKLFHTAEGGAIFCKDEELFHKLFYSHNFGHNGPLDFHGLGINAKISELQAAMGLAVFPHIEEIVKGRRRVVDAYNNGIENDEIEKMKLRDVSGWNYSYYPVLFSSEEALLKVDVAMKQEEITCRRYFYPSLNTLNYVDRADCVISESVAKRILCLPLYPDLGEADIHRILRVINDHQ